MVHTIEFLKYDNNLKYPLCVTTALLIGNFDSCVYCRRNRRMRGGSQTWTLHTAGASEIWIDQSAFSGREKLYCPDITAIVRSLIG